MAGIFISYRRDDAGPEARRLWEALAARFGAERVFMDVVTLEPGEDFARAIREKVAFCDALVAVIGPSWLDCAATDGRRRLDDPDDWVRLEIAAGLSEGVRVIPALVGGAALPAASRLPAPLAELPRHQGVELRHESFDADVDRLAAVLQRRAASGNIVMLWLALLSRRHRALDPLALGRPETLWRAFGFLLVMMLISAILKLPATASAGVQRSYVLFLTAYVLTNYVEWLALATALHFGMRALGGRATLQTSVSAFSFLLGAWLPLIALSHAPVWGLTISVVTDMTDLAWSPAAVLERMLRFVHALGRFGTVRLFISFALATLLWLMFLASIFAAFRTLHGVRRARAFAGLLLGLTAGSLFAGFVYTPLLGAVYAAFGIAGR